jgi:hypothetical protein
VPQLPRLRIGCLGLIFTAGIGIGAGQSVNLSVGVGQETVGGSVAVPINLASLGGAQAAAVQWSLSYSSDVTGVAFAAGTAATNAGKSLVCNGNTCLLYGINTNVISDGIVATVTLQISSNPSTLSIPIQITGVVAATPAGDSISAAGVSGTVLPIPALADPNSANLPAQGVLTADSVSPAAGGGLSQTFTFVFSNSQNANLAAAAMLFSSAPAAGNSCFIVYDRDLGTIQLESDDVTSNEIKPVGSSSTLQNSQCSIDATSVTATPLSTTINVEITFTSAFAGRKNIYMYGADGDGSFNTGWVQRGAYTVAVLPPPVPTPDSVSPDGGTGSTQTFTFVFSDSQDAANLGVAAMVFAPLPDVQNSCYVVYDRNLGTVQLEWDNVMGADVKPVGSPAPLQNSQCAIGDTSVTATALSTYITLDITFTSAFAGPKNVYMYGADGDGSINTGWVQKGTWTPNSNLSVVTGSLE